MLMMARIRLQLKFGLAAWLLAAAFGGACATPALAQSAEDDPWAEMKPKLTGLGKALWDFAGATPYLAEIPRADSVEAAGDYGYFLDEANGFLYSASWDGPCGCGEWFRAAAFKKSGGDFLLVKAGVGNTCYGFPMAEVSEPWAAVLPAGFSLQNFYRAGEQVPTDRGFFLIEVKIPEKGLELTLTARPVLNANLKYEPEKIFEPMKGWDWFERGGMSVDIFALPLRDDLAEAIREGRLDKFFGKTDLTPEDLRALAADLLRGSGNVWRINEQSASLSSKERGVEAAPGDIAQLADRLAVHYEIYREYLKLGVRSFILRWSRADNRFQIKDRVPLEPPPSFFDFILTDAYVFKSGC